MSLRSWVDKHPIPTALGIAVSSISTGVGVSEYFHDRSVERLEQENSIMTGQLKSRLAGIERRIGTGEQTYFDISRLVIPASRVGSLGPEFRNIADGSAFVDAPSDGNWRYSLISEADMIRLMLPHTAEGAIPNISMISEKNVHFWRGSGSYVVPTKMGGDITLFPYVMVQVVDNDQWAGAITQYAKSQNQMDFSELAGTLAKIQSSSPASESGGNGESAVRQSAELEKGLSNLFRGNVALILLTGVLQGNLAQSSIIPGARVDITAVEKRGNVLYIQSRLMVRGSPQNSEQAQGTTVAMETFVVSMPTRTILVKSVVPSRDGRSEAFQWVTRFLGGLRVPLENG
jgi:hypothetical protein